MGNGLNSGGPRQNFGKKSFNGSNYKSNNHKPNGGYKGNNFNSGGSSCFQYGNSRHNGSSMWSGSIENRFNVVTECQICNKTDHIAINCFHRNSNTSFTGFFLECQICGKR